MALWKIDPAHSEVSFKVKHLVVSTVTGHFSRFEATIASSEDDFNNARVSFEADVNSLNTKNEQRDAHLKSPDFFDSKKYPKISFVSTSVQRHSDHELQVTGKNFHLTIIVESKAAAKNAGRGPHVPAENAIIIKTRCRATVGIVEFVSG